MSSLECGQQQDDETDISDVPVTARADRSWKEEMEGQGSEEDSTASLVPRRRLKSQGCPAEDRMNI